MIKKSLTLLLGAAVLSFSVCGAAAAEPGKDHGSQSHPVNLKKTVQTNYQQQNKGNNIIIETKNIGKSGKTSVKKSHFIDVSEHWAVPQINAMLLQGIISGYPDATFQPEKPVTQNEALLMICRAAGLDNSETTSEEKWANVPEWMQASFNYAVKKGIITEQEANNFKGNTPAKRYEVAIWAARAAGLDANTGVIFADLSDIPSFARPYVGAMYRCRYMVGYPGNIFQPNKPIKRAEMCSLLFNMLPDLDKAPGLNVVKGTIEKIEGSKITVDGEDYSVSQDAEIFVNNKNEDLEDLKDGLSVVLYLNSDDTVLYLYAKDKQTDENETALKVVSFDPKNDAGNVDPDRTELKLRFNENIKSTVEDSDELVAGISIDAEASGNENVSIIKNVQVDDVDIEGNTLVINLNGELDYSMNYTVTIDGDLVKGENSGDKNDQIKWEFSTEQEDTLQVDSLTPDDDANNVDKGLDVLKIEFNKDIKAVDDEDEDLSKIKDAISINNNIDVSSVEIDGKTLTINLEDSLDYDTNYHVTIDKGVIEDEDDSDITNGEISWEFTTEEE